MAFFGLFGKDSFNADTPISEHSQEQVCKNPKCKEKYFDNSLFDDDGYCKDCSVGYSDLENIDRLVDEKYNLLVDKGVKSRYAAIMAEEEYYSRTNQYVRRIDYTL